MESDFILCDFGELYPSSDNGDTKRFDITFSTPVEVQSVQSTCSCVNMSYKTKGPRAIELNVRLTPDAYSAPGTYICPISLTVINEHAPKVRTAVLEVGEVRVKIMPRVRISPDSLDFAIVDSGSSLTQTLRFTSTSGSEISILNAEATPGLEIIKKVQISRICWELTVQIRDLKRGEQSKKLLVLIREADKADEEYIIPVTYYGL